MYVQTEEKHYMTVHTVTLPGNEKQSVMSRISAFFVYLFERVMPDPYVFAVILTFITAGLAFALVPQTQASTIAAGWYDGVFNILTFAFQVVLMLVAGHALASSPAVRLVLERIASLPKTPRGAVSLTIVISMVVCWIHWGFGLVTATLLAREIAKRIRLDFGWLIAAAYTGHVVAVEGLSGSVALSQATPGSALNIVEKVTGHILPLSETVFATFTLVPVLFLFVSLPFIFRFTEPRIDDSMPIDLERIRDEDNLRPVSTKGVTLATQLDGAWILNLLLAMGGFVALAEHWQRTGFHLDLNSVILIFLLLGILFHWRPIRYVDAVKQAARITGPLILQYPLYGGIMGIMTATGLAGVIAKGFLAFSTTSTLPFWSYISSLLITFFVPSGGGHWAVQGPFVIPAARELHASMAGTTMAVAMGESVANMIQPFFALPVLAIAGIGMRRVMGFMVITFVVALCAFGLSLLLLIPHG
jgi:short-chain fatty acids transporter